MTQQAKTILIGVLGFSALLATIGGSLALARTANKQDQTVDSTSTSSSVSSESEATSCGPGNSSSVPSVSSSCSNEELRDGPYITLSKSTMTLTASVNSDELPYSYFVPTIHNASDEDGTYATYHLALCCPTDGSYLEWLDFWVTDDQDHDIYAVTTGSGGTGVIIRNNSRVKVKMKKKPPIAGGYQLRLRVYSPYYDSSVVRGFIDVDLRTTR